jgi:hypothetical protein
MTYVGDALTWAALSVVGALCQFKSFICMIVMKILDLAP